MSADDFKESLRLFCHSKNISMPKFNNPSKSFAVPASPPHFNSPTLPPCTELPPNTPPHPDVTLVQPTGNFQILDFLSKKRGSEEFQEAEAPVKLKRAKKSSLNVKVTLGLTFKESVHGCTKPVEYQFLQACPVCMGINPRQPQDRCTNCDGTGKIQKSKRLDIEVPRNAKTGVKQVHKGKGNVGEEGGILGDLIVEYDVQDHPFFKRDGDDALCEVTISTYQAVLGSKIQIPKLYAEDGELLDIMVMAGTQPNESMRIAQMGFRKANCKKKRGNLLVTFKVEIPRQLTKEQRGLFEKLAVIESLTNLSNEIVDTCASK